MESNAKSENATEKKIKTKAKSGAEIEDSHDIEDEMGLAASADADFEMVNAIKINEAVIERF